MLRATPRTYASEAEEELLLITLNDAPVHPSHGCSGVKGTRLRVEETILRGRAGPEPAQELDGVLGEKPDTGP